MISNHDELCTERHLKVIHVCRRNYFDDKILRNGLKKNVYISKLNSALDK